MLIEGALILLAGILIGRFLPGRRMYQPAEVLKARRLAGEQ